MVEANYLVLAFWLICAFVAMKAFQSAADYLVDRVLEVKLKTSALVAVPARHTNES